MFRAINMGNPVIQEFFSSQQSSQPLVTTAEFRKRLARWLLASITAHLLAGIGLWLYPLFTTVMELRRFQMVDEDYNRGILVDFSQAKLKYPPGYIGFRPPDNTQELEKLKEEEKRRQRELARRRAEAKRRTEEAAKAEAEKQQTAKADPTPTPAPTPAPAPFGRINTRPIKEQIQRLYEEKKAGRLVFDQNKLKIGVAGKIMPDGSLSDYQVIVPSGNPQVDRAALAILDAVSESHALGPLYQLSSISMILEIDQRAELRAVGFAPNEEMAQQLAMLASALILAAKLRNEDPSAKDLIGNIKVSHTGKRVQAVINMPRQSAADSLAQTMEKPQ